MKIKVKKEEKNVIDNIIKCAEEMENLDGMCFATVMTEDGVSAVVHGGEAWRLSANLHRIICDGLREGAKSEMFEFAAAIVHAVVKVIEDDSHRLLAFMKMLNKAIQDIYDEAMEEEEEEDDDEVEIEVDGDNGNDNDEEDEEEWKREAINRLGKLGYQVFKGSPMKRTKRPSNKKKKNEE